MSSSEAAPLPGDGENNEEQGPQLEHLWSGTDKVKISFVDQLDDSVNKLVSVRDRIFLLTAGYSVFYGDVVTEGGGEKSSVEFRKIQHSAVDLASNSDNIFVVTSSGHVQKIDPKDLSITDTIILREDVKYCSHG